MAEKKGFELRAHPRGGWEVRGFVDDWEKLRKFVMDGNTLTFGYYGDAELDFRDGEFIVQNSVTGSIKYRGKNFKRAFFVAKGVSSRYDDINDRYFHSELERETLRRL